MNRKWSLILIIILAVLLTVFVLITQSSKKDMQVLELNSVKGVKITAPIQFSASENVTAVDFKVVGDIVGVTCTEGDFKVISKSKNGCVLANFDGGIKSGVVGSVTFIENSSVTPSISAILADSNGDNAQDAKIYIEY